MLVLTRRVGEQILINQGEIQIKVLHEHDGIIAIGVQAPSHVDIDRKEVFIRKKLNTEMQSMPVLYQ
ncbi:MAG: carbon storage regulator [Legionella sp.]|uniref:carbon storage regulator n=1 Tax=Legionella sp. TaxID=459 RepID=UPI0039E2E2D6